MSKEHCCCGCIHVKTGALIIGSLVLIFGIIGVLLSIATDKRQGILSNAFSVIIGGCIVYADISHKPGGYLPYLIFAVIGIVIYTIFIVFFVIMALVVPGTLSNYTQNYGYETQHYVRMYPHHHIDPKTVSEMLFFMAAVMAFVDWIAIWLWMVVYRAYQYMKGVEEDDRRQTYQVKLNDV